MHGSPDADEQLPEPLDASVRRAARGLRMAPREIGPHPGRGLAETSGWLSKLASFDDDVMRKAAEMSQLRPESLTVLVDIVNKCNLRCIMCHFSFDEVFYQRSQLMAPETFADIAATIRPFTRRLVLSAAYEPTASPHFGEILRIAGSHRFPEISFLTNGNLLSDTLVERIVEAGVTEVCVSVHAARAETYAHILRGGSLERAIGNVEKLLARRRARGDGLPRVQFNVALMRSNVDELVEIVELAARLGVDAVAFRHLIVFEGLDMEAESLARHDKLHANRCIRGALQRAQALGVTVTNACDYFDVDGFPAHSQCVGEAPAAAPVPQPARGRVAALWRRLRGAPAAPAAAAPPHPILGAFDTPDGDVNFYSPSVEISGWALAREGIADVCIGREPVPGDPPAAIDADGLVPLGRARFHNATRGDVVGAYPDEPHVHRAGWAFTLRRRDLPAQTADGTVQICVIARERNGNRLMLGRRTVRLQVAAGTGACHVRCRKPFDSLYIDARSNVFPYSDCHTDKPFGRMDGRPFEAIWNDRRLAALRRDMVAGNEPGMCVRCPLFINRDVDDSATFEAHADFSTETMR